mmetsp:Transcript_5777/g.17178  ORF Transcript_5777/g.17178 Transcript_5777/m.17178 type:complete len:283 (-) Transcript_5777:1351-2199(-)
MRMHACCIHFFSFASTHPSHVQMLVPLLHQLQSLVIAHPLPLDQLLRFRLALDVVKNGAQDQHESQKSHPGDLVPVHQTTQRDAQQYPRRHDQRKHDGPEVLDGVKDQQLTDGGTDGEHEEVQVDFGMRVHEFQRRCQFVGVDQRDGAQQGGKCRRCEHQFHHAQIGMPLEHPGLELRCEGVEEEEEEQEHHARPRCARFGAIRECLQVQFVRAGHEHGDSETDDKRDHVIICGVCLVAENLSHGHHWSQFETLEQRRGWEADVSQRLVLAPAAQHVGDGWE